MDTYLDPSLGGPLAFLDPSTQLHPSADPSSQPLNAFDYDAWLDPVAAPSYDSCQVLSASHGPPPNAPLALDARGSLSSAHFGVHLHSDPTTNARMGSAPLSPLSTSVNSSGSMHLSFAGPDYGEGIFHPRSSFAPQGYGHSSTSPMVSAPVSAHSEPGTESMSIAMYDRQVSNGDRDQLIGDYPSSMSSGGPSIEPLSPSTPVQAQQVPILHAPQPRHAVYPLQSTSSLRANRQSPPSSSRSKAPRTPQADESVPEAALHLLRLALPTGSAGSTATNTTGGEHSCDEDAEGESDDTSIHSTDLKALGQLFPDGVSLHAHPPPFETTVWNHSEGQPPLHVQRGGGPGSRRPSIASSAASSRVRQHIPARTQREASIASNRSRAGSEAPSASGSLAGPSTTSKASISGPAAAVGRRASARSRKSALPTATEAGSEGVESAGELNEEDAYDEDEASDSGKGKKKKAGKVTASKGKGRATKRASSAAETPPPAKKPRASAAKANPSASGPRKPRRQAYIPPGLSNRYFPPEVEISSAFPRFYRAFPISSAISAESYVLKMPGGANSSASTPRALPSSSQQNMLPTPPTPIYDQFSFGSHSPYSSAHSPPIASTSSSTSGSLPNISVDANGSFVIHDQSHAHPHAPFYPSYNLVPHAPQTPSSHAMSPPPLPQHSPAPSTSSMQSSMTTPANVAGFTLMSLPAEAKWNKAGDPFNLYYPRFVKGNADDKCGMCPICAEPPERGGEGEQKWLKLKNSSYVYHMSYSHGLSNVTGLPFSPPIKMRAVNLPHSTKDTRAQMTEGLCHKCNDWIPLLSVKNIDAIVPELIWWKHAKKCHGESTIPGERDPYRIDDLYNFVLARKNELTY